MATITEDYVSYETAKLLKEKGIEKPHQHTRDYIILLTKKQLNIT